MTTKNIPKEQFILMIHHDGLGPTIHQLMDILVLTVHSRAIGIYIIYPNTRYWILFWMGLQMRRHECLQASIHYLIHILQYYPFWERPKWTSNHSRNEQRNLPSMLGSNANQCSNTSFQQSIFVLLQLDHILEWWYKGMIYKWTIQFVISYWTIRTYSKHNSLG